MSGSNGYEPTRARELDAIDLHATVQTDSGVSIHMDGCRDAELVMEAAQNLSEVADEPVIKFNLRGYQGQAKTHAGFFLRVSELEELLGDLP